MRDHPLIRACFGQPAPYTPVWFMRQAGAYLPEHAAILDAHGGYPQGLIPVAATPELCAEVSVLPVEKLGVDAAVMYADIILPLGGMGGRFHYDEKGPVIEGPVRGADDARRLRVGDPHESVPFILEAVERVKERLGDKAPVIGFSGGPFTLAAYMVEGGPSAQFPQTKRLIREEPEAWRELMEKLTATIAAYLRAKAAAGADVLKLFDTWIGTLDRRMYEETVLPYTQRIFRELRGCGKPLIHFGVQTGPFLDLMPATGADVIGVDQRVPLDEAWETIGHDSAIQGNLDPKALLAPEEEARAAVKDVLRRAGGRPGHIFNLGHRVPLEADPAAVRRVVEWVRAGL